jgi:hypothetical protein
MVLAPTDQKNTELEEADANPTALDNVVRVPSPRDGAARDAETTPPPPHTLVSARVCLEGGGGGWSGGYLFY